jgi:uncharacterized repeat protein (TIGR01451 family)
VVVLTLCAVAIAGLATSARSASPVVTIGSVDAAFYPDPANRGVFNATSSSTPSFRQTFPVLNFNPPSTSFCSNAVAVNQGTRPFTDVVPKADGTCTTIPAQGGGVQAGNGSLSAFQAAFGTSLTLAGPTDVTFSFYSDDGWIAGIGPGPGGQQPTYVSGPKVNVPASGKSPIHGYPVIGAYNRDTGPVGQQVVVHFPAAGTYPAEFDYEECCGGALVFTLQANGQPIPPSNADLSVEKSAPASAMILGQIAYTLTVRNDGPNPATGVILTDALPAGVQLVSATTDRGGCSTGGTVTCDLGSLDAGASVAARIVVSAPLLPGDLSNTATVKGTEDDPDQSNNSASATTQVNLLPPPPAPPEPTPSASPSPSP